MAKQEYTKRPDTHEEAQARETIARLRKELDAVELIIRPVLTFDREGQTICPWCGAAGRMQEYEDVLTYRDVREVRAIDEGDEVAQVLSIEEEGSVCWEATNNTRLVCQECYENCRTAEGLEIEYD
jgi:hypothetical protein